jgi:hypothetical protein
MTAYSVAPLAIHEYDLTGCTSTINYAVRAAPLAIKEYDLTGCPFILGVRPDANVELDAYTDIVCSVFSNKGALTLDSADVTFTAGSITKTTDAYSILTFGNTMTVHLEPDDVPTVASEEYTATITTADAVGYSMTGTLNVVYSVVQIPLVPPARLTGTMPSGADITEVD